MPAVQNRLIHAVTGYISNKTHTKVLIGHIRLRFPKSIVIDNIFMEDLKHDTLLSAAEIKVNIGMFALLRKNININELTLTGVNVNLNRTEKDSLFNYDFLIQAFSSKDTAATKKNGKSSWEYKINRLRLEHCRFSYNDLYGGTILFTNVSELDLKMDRFVLRDLDFAASSLVVNGLNIKLLVTRHTETTSTNNRNPRIRVKKIEISNTSVIYDDSLSRQSATAMLGLLRLQEGEIDLQKTMIRIGSINMEQSKFLLAFAPAQDSATLKETGIKTNSQKSAWKIDLAQLKLANDEVAVKTGESIREKVFNPSDLDYRNIGMNAMKLHYSADRISADLQQFSTIDKNGFGIRNAHLNFKMDANSLRANAMEITTYNSNINGTVALEYHSLQSFRDSLKTLQVDVLLKNSMISNNEILYYSPSLGGKPFFKNSENTSMISATITGRINDLTGKDILLKTEEATSVRTNIRIRGLPEIEQTFFDIPGITIRSTAKDIENIVGSAALKAVSLPESFAIAGNFRGTPSSFESDADLVSDYGAINCSLKLNQSESFVMQSTITSFNLGKLLRKEDLLGPLTMTIAAQGKGLSRETFSAKVGSKIENIYLNRYNYSQISIDGDLTGYSFDGAVKVDDKNLALEYKGLVNIKKDEEQFKFTLDLKGADLQKLGIYDKDLKIGLFASTDLQGKDINSVNGRATISQLVLASNGKKYFLDSLLFTSVNESGRSSINLSSALIGIKYEGTFAPDATVKELRHFINNYFPIDLKDDTSATGIAQKFNFEIQLHNHPVISEVFLPDLKTFEQTNITGSFDSQRQLLELHANIQNIEYGSIILKNLQFDLSSDQQSISYTLSSDNISGGVFALNNISVAGAAADKKFTVTLSALDEKKNKNLYLSTTTTRSGDNYELTITDDLYLMNNRWTVTKDNQLTFGKPGVKIHNLEFKREGSLVSVNSIQDNFSSDIKIEVSHFQLADLLTAVSRDSVIASGITDGSILLKKTSPNYGIIADAGITELHINEILLGNLHLAASNPAGNKFNFEAALQGSGNDLKISGTYNTADTSAGISAKIDINSLAMQTAEAVSFGQISETAGSLHGSLEVKGSIRHPGISGDLIFSDAMGNPKFLNSRILLKNETVMIRNSDFSLQKFSISDESGNIAVLDGKIMTNNFSKLKFDFTINTSNFKLFDTKYNKEQTYYGKMILDSRAHVTGDQALPVITAAVKLKEGTNFTFIVPEKEQTASKGEDVVIFIDTLSLNPILRRDSVKTIKRTMLSGLDISATIETDPKATLKLILDPSSNDSLIVRGDAALSFALDRSGKMTLTGSYNLTDGSYLVSFETIVKRKFVIEPGSTMVWNGDPLTAEMNINAVYTVRTSPIDLVADQVTQLSETDRNSYKQRYPFLVYLKLRGELMHPDISFEIRLPPEDKGILGGTVNAKLNMLNEDQSSLNKQVFALIVLRRFIQEDPLQSESSGLSTAARTTVGKFLSEQLNQLSAKVVPGVELNFDVESYDDYSAGRPEGRTQVDIGVKKQLFNDRLTVQVGGVVDVEGEKVRQNSASDITSDVILEYKMTEDGRYRLKGFRHNQYEGALEGQLIETGAGILYSRDFNKWMEFFRKPISH